MVYIKQYINRCPHSLPAKYQTGYKNESCMRFRMQENPWQPTTGRYDIWTLGYFYHNIEIRLIKIIDSPDASQTSRKLSVLVGGVWPWPCSKSAHDIPWLNIIVGCRFIGCFTTYPPPPPPPPDKCHLLRWLHFQINFLEWKIYYFDSNIWTKSCSATANMIIGSCCRKLS